MIKTIMVIMIVKVTIPMTVVVRLKAIMRVKIFEMLI